MNPRKLGIFLKYSLGAYRQEPSFYCSQMESEKVSGEKNMVAASGHALGPDGEIRAATMAGLPCVGDLGLETALAGRIWCQQISSLKSSEK